MLEKAQINYLNSDLTRTQTVMRGGLHKQKSYQNQAKYMKCASVAMAESLLFITCSVRA